jgi:hypothetical protein
MAVAESSRAVLRRAFKHLEGEVPVRLARQIRNLRHPDARWIRLPVGLLMILGGVFSILPVLGIWMLPVGVLLIAYDVRLLRRPVGRLTIWSMRRWATFRHLVPLKALLLGSALLSLIPFLVTLWWWSDAGFERSGSHWTAAYRIFLIIGLPSGITSLLLFWRWLRSSPLNETGQQ